METVEIFGIQFVLSVIVFALIARWYIPTFLVPLLVVTQVMVFARLVGRGQTNHKSTQ
jgi:hypothetical protein|tara:strand:+ start:3912 stop:4085 length:174 start_codon:yes stop_codon:yes gene_type:complete